MSEEMLKATYDAWSRDFSHKAAVVYVKNVTGQAPPLQSVIDAYTERDLEFNEWCKGRG